MRNIDIESLPQAVKNNELSKKEAARMIWEDVYIHPKKYGLILFSEDQKSELLLSIQSLFEKLFDKFIPGSISFRTFITGCIANYKNTFLKTQLINELERRTLLSYFIAKTEEDVEKYMINIDDEEECGISENKKSISDFTNSEQGKGNDKKKRIAELTALVLMMKACKDIDEDTLKSVSEFTGIHKAELFKTVEELKKSMERKEERSQLLIRKRNNAFFFHRKYMQQMTAAKSSEKTIRELKEKYNKQTKKWEIHNKNLSVRSNTPSNKEIAKIIGLKPRTVSFYINHAKKESNRNLIRELYKKDEIIENQEN